MVFFGGLAGRFAVVSNQEINAQIHFGMIAFGGGILLAAVALVLLPPALNVLPLGVAAAIFFGGAVCFMFLDRFLGRIGGSYSQLAALLSDFIPEAVALGATFIHDSRLGAVLAFFIGMQNFPEGFNAYRELRHGGWGERRTLTVLLVLSFIGPLAAAIGIYLLSMRPVVVGGLMIFAAGGILYLTFQDIAPMSRSCKRYAPALGACLGFLFGFVGEQLIGH